MLRTNLAGSLLLLFIFVFTHSIVRPQSVSFKPKSDYKLIVTPGFVEAKNYYLLTLLSATPEVNALLLSDEVLTRIGQNKRDTLSGSIRSCGKDKACLMSKMQFTAEEIKVIGERLGSLYKSGNALDRLVKTQLIPSGTYVLFQNLPPNEMLIRAWEQDAMGLNFAISVYAGGTKPNYPNIDSISLPSKDIKDSTLFTATLTSLIYNTAGMIADKFEKSNLFFSVPLEFALRFIEMNERNQAADFEPMEKGENKKAYEAIARIQWNKYPYSVILIPGAGPDDPEMMLSAEGMIRCQLAAIQYKKGLAPFIITSGGKVHPYKTKFCEATEMKRYLVNELQVPESAVIIDPHARHTTTNMRNAARLIFRYKIPFDKAGITCTTRGQSFSIGSSLAARCMKELGHVPFKTGKRLSETLVEFYPLIEALHIDPTEPMDP